MRLLPLYEHKFRFQGSPLCRGCLLDSTEAADKKKNAACLRWKNSVTVRIGHIQHKDSERFCFNVKFSILRHDKQASHIRCTAWWSPSLKVNEVLYLFSQAASWDVSERAIVSSQQLMGSIFLFDVKLLSSPRSHVLSGGSCVSIGSSHARLIWAIKHLLILVNFCLSPHGPAVKGSEPSLGEIYKWGRDD